MVVPTADDMDAMCRRIRKNWNGCLAREPRDYITNPKNMGYRARHFVVERDGRAVEVQVRTVGQQRWADAVESADSRLKLNLKDEEGPEALIENFQIAGEFIYRREWDLEITDEMVERLSESNSRVITEGYYTA